LIINQQTAILKFELEGGEAVINKRSTSMYGGLLSAINQSGGGVRFADGGILGATQTAPTNLLDYDLLATKISDSNRSLPSPVVAVDEFNRVNNNVNVIETTASF
jgi:hypothetical protein